MKRRGHPSIFVGLGEDSPVRTHDTRGLLGSVHFWRVPIDILWAIAPVVTVYAWLVGAGSAVATEHEFT